MRRGMPTFAFRPLEAVAAVTSAWEDNQASLEVSRALGYQPNGVSQFPRGEQLGTLAHLRLTREQWLATDGAAGWTVERFEPCRAPFGAQHRR